jgi:pilus assembly protein FimV
MAVKNLSRAVALLLAASPAAFGLGLGDIRLLSSLNAPLDAEIELVGATPEELAGLKAQIAPRETFTRYKLDWPAFMGSITVEPMRTSDGRDVIKLRSNESITEPFVTLLVEANWARGKLIREYTMLLDPPVYTPGQTSENAAQVAAPVAGQSDRTGTISRPTEPSRSSAQDAEPSSADSSSDRAQPPAAPSGPGSLATEPDSTRVVQRGDTLSGIASEIAGGDPRATRRWMLAIYRANPRAFDGNMNILRRGAELQIPDRDTAQSISIGDASAEIRQQHAAWRGSAPEPSESSSAQARLRLVPPASDAVGAGSSSGATGGDTAALQGRVRELEAQLQESRRLIELRNAELARLQAQVASRAGQPDAAAPDTSAATEAPIEPPVGATPSTEVPADQQVASDAETPAAAPSAEAVAETPAEPVRPPAATRDQPREGSLLDTIKEYWWALAALLLAIAALLGLRAWRSRQQSEFDDSLGRLATADANRDFNTSDTAPIRALGPEPSFVVEESGTHERPRFAAEGAAAPRNVSTEDTISSDTAINLDQGDPLAEADFHMAYGLYDQAADLVRIAIAREPERRDLKLKLLEVFFVWGNKEQFLQAARELAQTREDAAPGEWEKIVIMGKQLAPEDELFAGGAASGAAAGGVDLDLEGGQSRVDFDLLGEPIPSEAEGVDLDIGSALGDKDTTMESPTRTTDAHLVLHDSDASGDATTRQMTQRVRSENPEPILPDYGLESTEAPTVEQPAMPDQGSPTIRQKVDMALRQSGAEQTAELNIDDLGLDLTALDTVDQPGLGSLPDAPTLVAGLDEQSRRVMEDAERRGRFDADEPTGPAATGAWRVSHDDLDATMPPTTVQALEADVNATSRMAAIKETDLDFDFDSHEEKGGSLDLDVGTATVPDASHAATQRISAEDLALPDLEPVTMSEVGTKLDLARAYMDMGDPEGARNILDEVLQEGSVTQKQEAQRLLESLPG